MTVEFSPLSPRQLAAVRADMEREADRLLGRANRAFEAVHALRIEAKRQGWLTRWWLLWRAARKEARGLNHMREARFIRRALKDGDEGRWAHRGARRQAYSRTLEPRS